MVVQAHWKKIPNDMVLIYVMLMSYTMKAGKSFVICRENRSKIILENKIFSQRMLLTYTYHQGEAAKVILWDEVILVSIVYACVYKEMSLYLLLSVHFNIL